jgi:hypothetical protein
MPLKVDLSRFKHFVKEISAARGKPEAEIVNKGLVTAVIGSNRYQGLLKIVPKAAKAKIKADLERGKLGIRLVMRKLKAEGYFKTRHTRAELQARISAEFKKLVAARYRGIGVMAVSLLKAALELKEAAGIEGKAQRARGSILYPRGEAAQGFAIKATPARLQSVAASAVENSEKILQPYVQEAMDAAANDMRDYFLQKLGKIYAKAAALP